MTGSIVEFSRLPNPVEICVCRSYLLIYPIICYQKPLSSIASSYSMRDMVALATEDHLDTVKE